MAKFPLSTGWQVRTPTQPGAVYPAVVPGSIFADLLRAGQIPDPFDRDYELDVQWVPDQDWEYSCVFTVPEALRAEERLELVFDGLDTLAEVFLNEQPLGETRNMFVRYAFDVTGRLAAGENRLRVLFHSPTRYGQQRNRERALPAANDALPGAPYLRKAPYQFGWDWGPKLPPVGIWRPVWLAGYSTARLSDVRIRQRHANGGVTLQVEVSAEVWDVTARPWVDLTLLSPAGDEQRISTPLVEGRASFELAVESPQLWWTNDLGEQPLYRLQVDLLTTDRLLEQRSETIGLRTLELRREPDRWGQSFTFVLNGVPLFTKGSNWIPADSFPELVTPARYEHLLRSAADSHQNMLRVWGGGIFEDPIFYDLCDRLGILIWQDFLFSCAVYPLNDPAFRASLRPEIVHNVRQLRHHACLALWCGNNEIETGWVNWGWTRTRHADLKQADIDFFYAELPDWIAGEDDQTTYWPSSPSSHLPHENPDSFATGDAHLWQVWHANQPVRYYREQMPRFASEFGLQSFPAMATIRAFARPKDLNLTSRIMEHHQRSPVGNEKIIHYLAEHFRIPNGFESWVYLSQVMQAEAMRIGIEHWRRNRDRCSGALYWQLNDCWPVASWSSIDYFGRWKALHHAARRFFRPLHLSVDDQPDRLGLYLTNDLPAPTACRVIWWFEQLDGQRLEGGEQAVEAAPLATTPVLTLDLPARLALQQRRKVVLVTELWQADACVERAVTPLVFDKHLDLREPDLTWEAAEIDGQLQLTLHAAALARFVEVDCAGIDLVFSDNFFDLPAGVAVPITAPLPPGVTLEQVRAALTLRSLIDTYRKG